MRNSFALKFERCYNHTVGLVAQLLLIYLLLFWFGWSDLEHLAVLQNRLRGKCADIHGIIEQECNHGFGFHSRVG